MGNRVKACVYCAVRTKSRIIQNDDEESASHMNLFHFSKLAEC
jgi:hypothetical protein